MEVKTATCSREVLGRFLKEEEEDGEFDRFSDWTFTAHLQYSKHIISFVRCLKRPISPGAPSLEART